MAPPRSGCCRGPPLGEPGALFWGREGPGVPRIVLPSPGGRGCPPCLLVVGDVGAPLLREGPPLLWGGVTHCLAVLRTYWGGVPSSPTVLPLPPSPPACVPPPQNGSQVLLPSVPRLGMGGGVSSCCFPLPLGGLDPSIQTLPAGRLAALGPYLPRLQDRLTLVPLQKSRESYWPWCIGLPP